VHSDTLHYLIAVPTMLLYIERHAVWRKKMALPLSAIVHNSACSTRNLSKFQPIVAILMLNIWLKFSRNCFCDSALLFDRKLMKPKIKSWFFYNCISWKQAVFSHIKADFDLTLIICCVQVLVPLVKIWKDFVPWVMDNRVLGEPFFCATLYMSSNILARQ
jgi:hypothetical protein